MSDSKSMTKRPGWMPFLIATLPYLVIYAVAIWLVAMTDSDAAKASGHWLFFIPLVALVSIIGGWRYAGLGGRPKTIYLLKQVLHWAALLVVINLLFTQSMQQFLNAEDHGFVIMYLLGLTAILSGIYLDWKMAVFGAFLIGSAITMGYIEDNIMVILISVGVAALAVVLMLVVTLLVRKRLHQPEASA